MNRPSMLSSAFVAVALLWNNIQVSGFSIPSSVVTRSAGNALTSRDRHCTNAYATDYNVGTDEGTSLRFWNAFDNLQPGHYARGNYRSGYNGGPYYGGGAYNGGGRYYGGGGGYRGAYGVGYRRHSMLGPEWNDNGWNNGLTWTGVRQINSLDHARDKLLPDWGHGYGGRNRYYGNSWRDNNYSFDRQRYGYYGDYGSGPWRANRHNSYSVGRGVNSAWRNYDYGKDERRYSHGQPWRQNRIDSGYQDWDRRWNRGVRGVNYSYNGYGGSYNRYGGYGRYGGRMIADNDDVGGRLNTNLWENGYGYRGSLLGSAWNQHQRNFRPYYDRWRVDSRYY